LNQAMPRSWHQVFSSGPWRPQLPVALVVALQGGDRLDENRECVGGHVA